MFGTDPLTKQPIHGLQVNAGGAAKVNLPIPPVELHGNANYTWLGPQFNVYDLLVNWW